MRRVTSILLAISFLAVALTGLYMALVPHGGHGGPPGGEGAGPGRFGYGAPDGDAAGLGMARGAGEHHEPFFPRKLHEWSGYAIAIVGIVHLVLNFNTFLGYLGLRRKSTPAPAPAEYELGTPVGGD